MIDITLNNMPYFSIHTLGCKVNQYESEVIKEKLEAQGYIFTDFKSKCDVYIINTCAVTAESSRKSCQLIRRAVNSNPDAIIAVTGCQSQLAAEMIADIKGIDIICGNYNKLLIVDQIIKLIDNKSKCDVPVIVSDTYESDGTFDLMDIKQFGRTRAYVKIQDGCNNNCAYCIIPKIRGNVRSKPLDDVIREANHLVRNSCKEIVLIGIETSSYKDITKLIAELQSISGLERIRLGSLDPSFMRPSITDELMAHSKFAPHLHLSMQSGCDKILHSMRRKYNTDIALRNIEYIKKVNNEVNFTTDIMVGFPGESEIDFNETVSFIKIVNFLHIHVFKYSIRPGTEAATMINQISEFEKNQRAVLLTDAQNDIKRSIYNKYVEMGKSLPILVETYDGHTAIGHTPNFLEIEVISHTNIKDKIINIQPVHVNDMGDKIIGEIVS